MSILTDSKIFFEDMTYYTGQCEIWRDMASEISHRMSQLTSVISALFLEAHPLVHELASIGLQHSCISIIESAMCMLKLPW